MGAWTPYCVQNAVRENGDRFLVSSALRLLQARAIENQACVVGVNRIGRDPQHVYTGRSVIVDYHGEILADACDREGCINARLELAPLLEYRRELPFLADLQESPSRRQGV